VILCDELTTHETAHQIAERVHSALAVPIEANGRYISAAVSLGIALVGPEDHTCAETLISDAVEAMYRAKRTQPETPASKPSSAA
jgi:GGDEF domain-containing protein